MAALQLEMQTFYKAGGIYMAIGERIRFIRNLRGMTQKFLGLQVGFSERTADIRMAQYESGSRTPKADLVEQLANVLDVSTEALNVPNIDSYTGLMHTLFALEDLYGLKIDTLDGELCIRLNKQLGSTYTKMYGMLEPWEQMAQKYRNGEITREEYDQWRYRYPRSEAERNEAALQKIDE
jgi:transcriptional regulator with XRE-family HTH domain